MTSIDLQHDHMLYKIVYLVTVIQYKYMYVHVVFDINCIEINGFLSFFKCVPSLCFQLHMITHPRYDNIVLNVNLSSET